jgi:hypothetical protein
MADEYWSETGWMHLDRTGLDNVEWWTLSGIAECYVEVRRRYSKCTTAEPEVSTGGMISKMRSVPKIFWQFDFVSDGNAY